MKKFNIIAIIFVICVWGAILTSLAVQAATYRTNESCTAYVASGDKMANGEWPEIGYVAVHPTIKNGGIPIIPFGTYLYIDYIKSQNGTLDTYFSSPQGEISVLRVGDIGDKKYDQGLTTYFVDLFFGDHLTEAKNWGNGTIYYHYN